MSNRVLNYEELYGVGLLDDLHNYFPALLYDAEGFRSVQEVLQYISLQTRRRFDLYSFGLSAYEEANERRASVGANSGNMQTNQFYQSPAPAPRSAQTIPISPPPESTNATSSSSPPPVQQSLGRVASPPPSSERMYRYVVDLGDERFDIGEHLLPAINPVMSPPMLTSLLAGLVPQMRVNNRTDELSAVASLLLRMGGAAAMPNLDPVVVRPTTQQIERATEVLTPETEQDCAICQDSITTSQECRKILHCGHWFHKDCIDPWFRQNVQCPVCRFDIRQHPTQQNDLPTSPPSPAHPEEDYH